MGARATFIAEPLTTTRKALSITVDATHHLYEARSGEIAQRCAGWACTAWAALTVWTGAGAGINSTVSVGRESATGSLYMAVTFGYISIKR